MNEQETPLVPYELTDEERAALASVEPGDIVEMGGEHPFITRNPADIANDALLNLGDGVVIPKLPIDADTSHADSRVARRADQFAIPDAGDFVFRDNAFVPLTTPDSPEPVNVSNEPFIVETHAQAAEINAHRTAEQGYVKVGDEVTE